MYSPIEVIFFLSIFAVCFSFAFACISAILRQRDIRKRLSGLEDKIHYQQTLISNLTVRIGILEGTPNTFTTKVEEEHFIWPAKMAEMFSKIPSNGAFTTLSVQNNPIAVDPEIPAKRKPGRPPKNKSS